MEGLEFGFSASGWLMLWQLGVCHALQRHSIGFAKDAKFIGSSGGAACSAALALDVDAQLLADFMLRCCSDYHRNSWRKMFQMREYAKACIERCMEAESFSHKALVDGRLNVVVTLVPSMKRVVVNQFASNDEYLEACLASCTATPFAGFPIRLKSKNPDLDGKFALDGGATDMMPSFSKKTIRVSPLYCLDAEIKPSRYIPLHWGLFPPSVKEMQELFWLGAKDGMTWLHQNGYGSFKLEKKQFRAKRTAECKSVARIKRIARRYDVSAHSSYDLTVSNANPHTYSVQSRTHGGRAYSGSTSSVDSFSTVKINKLIEADSLKSGHAMTLVAEGAHKVGDSMAVAVLLASVKPMALGVVCSEIAVKAALSATSGLFATLENKRRESTSQSSGLLSMRRWVHDSMVGSANEGYDKAKGYVSAALDPMVWLSHLPVGQEIDPKIQANLFSKSATYRFFARASLW